MILTEKTQQALQRALALLMSDISEESYCATWMTDIEFDLWQLLQSGTLYHNGYHVTKGQRSDLELLSDLTGGWIMHEGAPDYKERFVPLEEWLKKYEEWKGQ